MKQTAVEWLAEQLSLPEYGDNPQWFQKIIEQGKQMEKEQSHNYAEFAIRCDRKDMKILNFEDYIKL